MLAKNEMPPMKKQKRTILLLLVSTCTILVADGQETAITLEMATGAKLRRRAANTNFFIHHLLIKMSCRYQNEIVNELLRAAD